MALIRNHLDPAVKTDPTLVRVLTYTELALHQSLYLKTAFMMRWPDSWVIASREISGFSYDHYKTVLHLRVVISIKSPAIAM